MAALCRVQVLQVEILVSQLVVRDTPALPAAYHADYHDGKMHEEQENKLGCEAARDGIQARDSIEGIGRVVDKADELERHARKGSDQEPAGIAEIVVGRKGVCSFPGGPYPHADGDHDGDHDYIPDLVQSRVQHAARRARCS